MKRNKIEFEHFCNEHNLVFEDGFEKSRVYNNFLKDRKFKKDSELLKTTVINKILDDSKDYETIKDKITKCAGDFYIFVYWINSNKDDYVCEALWMVQLTDLNGFALQIKNNLLTFPLTETINLSNKTYLFTKVSNSDYNRRKSYKDVKNETQ